MALTSHNLKKKGYQPAWVKISRDSRAKTFLDYDFKIPMKKDIQKLEEKTLSAGVLA